MADGRPLEVIAAAAACVCTAAYLPSLGEFSHFEADGPLVHDVHAPADSALAAALAGSRSPANAFDGWGAAARELLPSP